MNGNDFTSEHGTWPQQILQHRLYPKTITRPRSFCANNLRLYWSIGRNWPSTDWRCQSCIALVRLLEKCVDTNFVFIISCVVGWPVGANHFCMHFAFDPAHNLLNELRTQTSEWRLRIEYFVDSNQVESNIHFISFLWKNYEHGKVFGPKRACALCVERNQSQFSISFVNSDWAIELCDIHSVKEIVMMLLRQQIYLKIFACMEEMEIRTDMAFGGLQVWKRHWSRSAGIAAEERFQVFTIKIIIILIAVLALDARCQIIIAYMSLLLVVLKPMSLEWGKLVRTRRLAHYYS